ncbi:MAG: SDR family oxidoreductase [Lentisphaerae bacterium]|nr:SDR family oxidoreductase [Lentisphaerota bacterium]
MSVDPSYDFHGHTAVVTGGSGVLCGALAAALARRGAAVAILAHGRLERARDLAERLTADGARAIALQADVMDREQLRVVHADVNRHFGPVDLLINGAGGARPEATTSPERPFAALPEAAVREVFDLNFMGTFLACQEFVGDMLTAGSGAILNLASMGAVRPLTRSVAYSAAKAAVVNLTQWLAVHLSQEYGPGVRVNALVPGFFLTEQNRFLLQEADGRTFTARGRRILEHTPMGRLGEPDDLVGPALFLLSDAARFVHGTTLAVDGGLGAFGGV